MKYYRLHIHQTSLVLFTVSLLVGCWLLLRPHHVAALSGSNFNAAHIIDDGIFFNANTMNTGDIQNFLNAKVPTCDTNGTQASTHGGYATRADWGRANGAPPPYTCLKNYSQGFDSKSADAYCGGITGGTKSAANIIFDVSQACGINPETMIILLQKEQSLITDDWPWPIQYRSATGYGCPDTAACDSAYYGFFNQVYNAARQFKRYVQQPGSFNYAAGRNSYILYNPNSGCGGTNVTIQNPATAALYNYTPYQPNTAALANLYGTGDGCSAYGNRNFWRLFNDWFGSTTGNGFVLAKSEDPNDLRQWVIYGSIKQYVPDSQTIYAWGLQNVSLINMAPSYLDSISTGPNLDRLMRSNRDPGALYFLDGGKKYVVHTTQTVDAWNLGSKITSYVSDDLFNLPTSGGSLTYGFKYGSNYYMVDGANGSNQTVIRPYQSETVFKAWEGDNAGYVTVSSQLYDQINDAIGATLTTTKVAYGGTEHQVDGGYRMDQPNGLAALYPGVAQSISAATFNRLTYMARAQYMVKGKSGPEVYLLDNGQKHHILWPDLLSAWSTPTAGYNTLDDAYVDLIPTGDDISNYMASTSGGQLYVINGQKIPVTSTYNTAYQATGAVYTVSSTLLDLFSTASTSATGFIKGASTPQVYLLDNSGRKRLIEYPDKLSLWAGSTSVTVLGNGMINAIGSATSPQNFVSDGTSEFVMEGGQKLPVSSITKAKWGLSNSQVFSDGTLSRFTTGSSLGTELKYNGAYFVIRGGAAYGTVDPNIADMWGLTSAPTRNSALISSLLPSFSLTRFVRSSTDNRIFFIESGSWYNVDVGPRNNLGYSPNEPIMTLNPNNAPNSITDWTSFIIKSSGGTYYVIDTGGKRSFPAQMILDHWTHYRTLPVPTVSDGFINSLPYVGIVERTIKGSAPMVYSAENETKRHILYSNTYNQYYAPYGMVGDRLLDTMPNGSPIN